MEKRFPFAIVIILMISACAGLPGPEDQLAGTSPPPPEKTSPIPEDRGDRLEDPAFAGLPPEARAYLKTLSRAFRTQNRPFLLAQGEGQFEQEVRPRYDEETYLALLYRTGPLSKVDADTFGLLPRLSPQNILRIEYSGWEEQGPLLEIQGRLIPAAGAPLPCRIMLVWRLREPKILGIFP
ncbi:hypothetical protein AGMMS49928_05230 [Spirochaetia bacterium]|nr:hypothetical protein AGMMS49928_05230 [Spirochaetia bacterium]